MFDPKEYLGPYERWTLGDGFKYMIPAIRYGDTAILSAMLKMDDAVSFQAIQQLLQAFFEEFLDEDAPDLSVEYPLRWSKASDVQYLPLVVHGRPVPRPGSPPELPKALVALAVIAAALTPEQVESFLSERKGKILSGSPSTGVFRALLEKATGSAVRNPHFRVNFPIENRAFWTGEPRWSSKGLPIVQHKPTPRPPEPPTILAIIDDGIAFAHSGLVDNSNMSRVKFCWLQGAPSDAGGGGIGIPGHDLLFGRELTDSDINALRSTYEDEDALYRAAHGEAVGAPSASVTKHAATHGAHVLDQMAGNRGDVVDGLDVIAVELPGRVGPDTSGFGNDMFVLSALHYIFERAKTLAGGLDNARLVINFSFGFAGGPHDGSLWLSRAIDELVAERHAEGGITVLTMPSGNIFLAGMHAVLEERHFEQAGPQRHADLPWRVQPNDRTSSFVELWFPKKNFEPDDYSVELIAPNGDRANWDIPKPAAGAKAEPQQQKRLRLPPFSRNAPNQIGDPVIFQDIKSVQAKVGQISADLHQRERYRVLVALAPTEPNDPADAAAPAGLWTIRVVYSGRTDIIPGFAIDCWIQRDTSPIGEAAGGKQSYFDEPMNDLYAENGAPREADHDCGKVRRFGSMSGMAPKASAMIVGAYIGDLDDPADADKARPARFSSAGPLLDNGGQPERPIASDNPPVVIVSMSGGKTWEAQGVQGAAARSGGDATLHGTSGVAPKVARETAKAFADPQFWQGYNPRDPILPHLTRKLSGGVPGVSPEGEFERRARLGKAIIPA